MDLTQESLIKLAKQFRLGSVNAEHELIHLAIHRLDDVCAAMTGQERASEWAHARVSEVREKDGDHALAQMLAKTIEEYEGRLREQRRRESRGHIRALTGQISETTIKEACQTTIPFVVVPTIRGTIVGLETRTLRRVLDRTRGLNITWTLSCAEGWYGRGYLLIEWAGEKSRGRMKLSLRQIEDHELVDYKHESEHFDDMHARLAIETTHVNHVPDECDDERVEPVAVAEPVVAVEPPFNTNAPKVTSASRSEAAKRAVETKRARRLLRQPGECLRRNGGNRMRHARDCRGCMAA